MELTTVLFTYRNKGVDSDATSRIFLFYNINKGTKFLDEF